MSQDCQVVMLLSWLFIVILFIAQLRGDHKDAMFMLVIYSAIVLLIVEAMICSISYHSDAVKELYDRINALEANVSGLQAVRVRQDEEMDENEDSE